MTVSHRGDRRNCDIDMRLNEPYLQHFLSQRTLDFLESLARPLGTQDLLDSLAHPLGTQGSFDSWAYSA